MFLPIAQYFQGGKNHVSRQNIQRTHAFSQAEWIKDWVIEFIKAKKIEGLSPNTICIYEQQLKHFMNFCERQMLERISQITSSDLRNFLLYLQEEGHNPGGIHGGSRSLKTFHRWYDLEAAPDNWRKPILQVKAPKKTLHKDISNM